MTSAPDSAWSAVPNVYRPLAAGSIDGTDIVPHDAAVARAMSASYTPNPTKGHRPERTLFVGRLDSRTDETALRRHFIRFGDLKSCEIVRDLVTGASRRYAFIEFASRTAAEMALRKTNHSELDGRVLLVDWEHGHALPGWVPRRLGGGFGGNRNSGQLRFGCTERPFLKPITR